MLACIFGFGAVGLQLAGSLHRSRGERLAGLQTLAATFGPEVGALIAALVVDTALMGAAIVCFGAQATIPAGVLAGTLLLQLIVQFLAPRVNRVAVSAVSMVLYMVAMGVGASSLFNALPQM